MAAEDKECAFCGEKILWNEEFSLENGKAYHVAPHPCWAEYLKSEAHAKRDNEEIHHERNDE